MNVARNVAILRRYLGAIVKTLLPVAALFSELYRGSLRLDFVYLSPIKGARWETPTSSALAVPFFARPFKNCLTIGVARARRS